MPKRHGSYLEESIAILFNKAGFKTKLNSRINGYEIDVLASRGNYRIAIECKQYERSRITIRNILHQWASKSNMINVDQIIIAIAGQKPKEEDYKLAKQLNLVLVDDYTIHRLNSVMDKEKLKLELNDLICFDKELYKQQEKRKLIKNLSLLGFFIFTLASIYFIKNNNKLIFFILSLGVLLALALIVRKNKRR